VHEVAEPTEMTLYACVQHILGRFALADRIEFTDLFPTNGGRTAVIVTFLALLEMIRLRVIRAHQAELFGSISLALAVASVAEATERVQDLAHELLDAPSG
jgi:chromatin segregation and condensation protein Rec8/ScpA/Scc1 (kleisin family)